MADSTRFPRRLDAAAWFGPASALLLLTGATALLSAIASDFMRGSTPGFGRGQMLLVLGGAASALGGAMLAPGGWTGVTAWLTDVSSARIARVARFATVAAQVTMLLLLVRVFRLENPAFHDQLIFLILFGFLIHHLLPLALRLPFFVVLSLGGILSVFGLADGAWMIAVGLALIALCHLPVPFALRVTLLVAAAGVLASMRAGQLSSPWGQAVWPILGSMFMFRLILYMYEVRHAKERMSPTRALAYFFLLPNVAFPLFPVVDYATLRRSHYDAEAMDIYQRGVRWMLLGLTHLVLYRLVYQYGTLSPADVATTGDLARYMVANFGLYLRVSGQFHLIVGILHLFGFRLPETHHFFFLSSSFTDFWRRINVYWKDFMVKIVYYPAFFRLRHRGGTVALVISTLLVFLATWILHSYQWFWLLGQVLLSWTDALFWAILAVFLVIGALRETKRGRKRALGGDAWPLRARLTRAAGTVVTFALICVLWSLWTSPTMDGWLALWAGARPTAPSLLAIGLAVAAAMAMLTLAWSLEGTRRALLATERPAPPFWRASAWSAIAMLALYLVGATDLTARLGPVAQEVARDLRAPELNRRDAALLQRGYYENLVGVNRFNSQLWEVYAERPAEWPFIWETDAARKTGDFLNVELRPMVGMLYRNASFRTNRWGMRDRGYDSLPPAGAYRVALLGASHVMGDGVGDGETFEWLIEDRLNRTADLASARYEILNFAVAGYTAAQQLVVVRNRALAFSPHVVMMVAHSNDPGNLGLHISRMLRAGVALPDARLAGIVARAGVDGATTEEAAQRLLQPVRQELLAATYDLIADECTRRGVRAIWVHVPTPGDAPAAEELEAMRGAARDAGFEVIDLGDIYPAESDHLRVAKWDWHPNAAGHRVIADHLYEALRARGVLPPAVTAPVAGAVR